jgi:lipoyl-dependent peroxiredoxin
VTSPLDAEEDKITETLEALGGRLKRLRLQLGRTLGNVASATGLSEAYVSRLEQGERTPSLPALIRLADVYGVSAASLLEAETPSNVALHHASSHWTGPEKEGTGTLETRHYGARGFSYASRLGLPEAKDGDSSPEEHVGAALAGCFSMSFSGELGKAGYAPGSVETHATVRLVRGSGVTSIRSIHLQCTVGNADIPADRLRAIALTTKRTCVVARALAAVDISVDVSAPAGSAQ